MHRIHSPSILTLLLLLLLLTANAETPQVRDSLVQFMAKLSPSNDLQRELNWGWNTTSDPCDDHWQGISCYNTSSTVKKVVLNGLNLTGALDAASLCQTKSLTVLSLKSNILVGPFPEEISNCSKLTHIFLHSNNLSGHLPKSLSRLRNLKRIDISDNDFSAEIPDMSRISGLLTFLAENNHLSGNIPNFDFSNLEDFNVSNNNLTGPIPNGGAHFGETSFLGNPGLCGKPLPISCPPSPPKAKNKGSSKKDYFIYSGYALIGLTIVSLVAFKLIKMGKQKEKKIVSKGGLQTDIKNEKVSSSSSSDEHKIRSEFSITSAESGKGSSSLVVLCSPVINGLKFEDLLKSPAELLGRSRHGSLYKVTLNEGVNLAVKRIKDWEISRDDFNKRMERIDGVRHPSVMPIVAFYCSRQEKLLVYEFQEKGSLFRLLHESKIGPSFDWGSRLNVAAKISVALAFMHEGLQSDGIAHGNLKSSNILLSNEMEPRISEYGLAEADNQDQRFIDSFQENSSPKGIINTTSNAFKGDIYSFGVILLELLTGKLVQNNGYDLARWVNSAIREEWTVEVFDKALVEEGAREESMVSLLQLALKCINTSSESRPSVREVVGVINSIKEHEEKSISSDP